MNRTIYSIIFLCMGLFAAAQSPADPCMADDFRADGKIWVVIGVIALVFLSLVGWLVMLEKRIGKLENSVHKTPGN